MSGPPPRRRVLRGIFLLARGRTEGFDEFGNEASDVVGSLVPLAALAAAAGVMSLLAGHGADALTDTAMLAVAMLAPSVVSHALANAAGRGALWPRFIATFNWCQWVLPVVGLMILLAVSVLATLGMPQMTAAQIALFSLLGYALWLQWFLARNALSLQAGPAALMVLMINAASAGFMFVPRWLARLLA